MRSYHYRPPTYRLPPSQYLPPPTEDIPLSEDEVDADAQYIPSRLIGPLLDFEDPDLTSLHQTAGDCIARLLTKAVSPAKPFMYHRGADQTIFTTEIEDAPENINDKSITITPSEYSVEDIPEELGIEPLQRIDYRHPNVVFLNKINISDLKKLAMMDIPQQWRILAAQEDHNNPRRRQPSEWRQMLMFLDARTPAFIQKVRDEISRRYIIMTQPEDPELKSQLFKAMEECRLAGVLTNLQKGVNARQRRVEQHGVSELAAFKQLPSNMTSRVLRKFVGPTIKHRKKRKARKTRRGRK